MNPGKPAMSWQSSVESSPHGSVLLWLAIGSAILCTALLWPVLAGLPFADDWAARVDDPRQMLTSAFHRLRPYELYRPLESLAISASLLLTKSTLLLRLLEISTHSILILICLHILRTLKAPASSWIIAAVFMATSQLNASALGGNDTFSLVLGTMAGTLASWLAMSSPQFRSWPRSLALSAILVVSLLAKESSLGYVPIVCAALWMNAEPRIMRRIRAILPPLLVVTAYFAWRSYIGAAGLSFDERSPFALGKNLLVNPLQLAFAATVPISTTDLFTAAHTEKWIVVLMGVMGALIVAAMSAYGFVALVGPLGVLPLLGVIVSISAPVLPMRHVSELYAYSLLPIIAIGFASGISILARSSRGAGLAMGAIAASVFLGNALALHKDAKAMAVNGERAASLMTSLIEEIRSLPEGTHVVLINPKRSLPEYSIFRMTNFRLTPKEDVIELAQRPDLTIEVVDSVEEGQRLGGRLYSLDGLTLVTHDAKSVPSEDMDSRIRGNE
jgi:hypothetical protein